MKTAALLTCYGRHEILENSLKSLGGFDEVLVGSSEEADRGVVERFAKFFQYELKEKNHGMILNRLAQETNADFLFFADADHIFPCFDFTYREGIVCVTSNVVESDTKDVVPVSSEFVHSGTRNILSGQGFLISKEDWCEFDERFWGYGYSDCDLGMRLNVKFSDTRSQVLHQKHEYKSELSGREECVYERFRNTTHIRDGKFCFDHRKLLSGALNASLFFTKHDIQFDAGAERLRSNALRVLKKSGVLHREFFIRFLENEFFRKKIIEEGFSPLFPPSG